MAAPAAEPSADPPRWRAPLVAGALVALLAAGALTGSLALLVFLHVLGAAVWVGGTVVVSVAARALRGSLPPDAFRGAMVTLGQRARPVLWGGFALAALSGLLLLARSGAPLGAAAFWGSSFGQLLALKGALVLLAGATAGLHARIGHAPGRRAWVVRLGIASTLLAVLAMLAGAMMRAG
ncbi:MAG TPA: hypothetical protein VGR28_01700 [Candidatus Thermoplasmatota archaeon]|nr:hypothetical protein [Candidatus Thermoplasmatota archaeon]